MINWFQSLFNPDPKLTKLTAWLAIPEDELKLWLNGMPSGYEYKQFSIPKRNKKESRKISAPNPLLRKLQRQVYRKLIRKLPVHAAATGFVPGKSIADNARIHVGKPMVISLDLKDYFSSTTEKRVLAYWQKVGWTNDEARVLTRMTCFNGGLPQGAPTSPALSNVVNYILDTRLQKLVKRFKGEYTRYADDITLSFAAPDSFSKAVLPLLVGIIGEYGYQIQKRKKVRIQRAHQRQMVTGLVVNREIHFPREMRRKVRAMQHKERMQKLDTEATAQLRGYEAVMAMLEK